MITSINKEDLRINDEVTIDAEFVNLTNQNSYSAAKAPSSVAVGSTKPPSDTKNGFKDA